MSLHSAIVARARANVYLYRRLLMAELRLRAASRAGRLPYIVFEVGPRVIEHTFGDEEDLRTARVEVNLYAASGTGLDLLENAWHSAFSRFSG